MIYDAVHPKNELQRPNPRKEHMKRLLLILIPIIVLLSCTAPKEEVDLNDGTVLADYTYDVTPDTTPPNRRVVVYIPYWDGYFDYAMDNTLDFTKVTHINLAFVNPDNQGNFSFPEVTDSALAELIAEAHSNNVKVLMSLGGANSPEVYHDLLLSNNVQTAVNKMINFMMSHQLDGIDVDLESDMITSSYNSFIETIHNTLPDDDMLLTAAVQVWTGNRITDESLALMDFINPMAYDARGPWTPNDPGQHSSYQFALDNINYWQNTRGIAPSKICLGVPFYGYDFSDLENIAYTSYRSILAAHSNAWNSDQVGQIYYNGESTIARKTALAKNYGGIMVWEISQDGAAPHSLLDVIHAAMESP